MEWLRRASLGRIFGLDYEPMKKENVTPEIILSVEQTPEPTVITAQEIKELKEETQKKQVKRVESNYNLRRTKSRELRKQNQIKS